MEKYLKGVEVVYKKITCIIIILAIVFPLLPTTGFATGYVKEIDAEFSNMEIQVEGKKISNHKEPFIYNDDIWVPLKDLGRGLGLNVKFNKNKKSIFLDSKGKLKKNIDKSTTSYQRGYEIETKENIKHDLEDEIDILEYGKNFRKTEDYIKKSKVRNIKVYFGDVKIYLDKKSLDFEGFMYNDDIYVPIDSISPYLYITPTYKSEVNLLYIDANGLLVKNKDYSSFDNLLGFREGQNYLLDIQLAQLEKRKEIVGSLKIPYKKLTTAKDLENYLNNYLYKLDDIPMKLEIASHYGNWIYLDIDFSSSRIRNWDKLQRRDVENWIWDIYSAILSLYNEDTSIYGAIRNPYYSKYSHSSRKNYVTFDTKNSDLYFDFTNSGLKKDSNINPVYLAEILEKNLNKYNNIKFEYDVETNGDDIYITTYSDSNDFANGHIYTKMGYLKRLNWEIKKMHPDLEVNGKIVFPNDKYEPIKFNLKDNRIRSVDLLKETEEYLNTRYGFFSYGRYDFGLKYTIHEEGLDNFRIIVEGDFSVSDEQWISAGETGKQILTDKVQNAIDCCASIWNTNVSTEIVDKNQVPLRQ